MEPLFPGVSLLAQNKLSYFLCLKRDCIAKKCTLYLFSNNLCIFKMGKKIVCEEVCVFSDKSLENNVLPFLCHIFDRFTSNIRSSYATLCLFLFCTHVSASPSSVTFFYDFFYEFISNDFFPECKCISGRKRRGKEIQVNELPSLN